MRNIKVAKLDEKAILPSRKHPEDAGMDFYSLEDAEIMPGETKVIHTGITMEIPKGYAGLIWPKSRHNFLIGAGVVDSGYQGEILIKVVNTSSRPLIITYGMPIAQMLIQKVETPKVNLVDHLHKVKTSRGNSGGILEERQTR